MPSRENRCARCFADFSRGFAVAERVDTIAALVDESKLSSSRGACIAEAKLLHHILPTLPENTVFVPIPTISSHIRTRGLDHTAKIAATLAKLRGLKSEKILRRRTSSVQRGANKATREQQAKSAFTISTPISPRTTYILVDDVYTTGATMKYAAKTLRAAGAQAIWVAVTAVQISL